MHPWPKHHVFDWVSNESPHFVNLIGDGPPGTRLHADGYFGWVEINPANAFEPWNFYPISERIAPERFGHGLGVGDVNGDGRLDVIMKDGWFEQPEDLDAGPVDATQGALRPARRCGSVRLRCRWRWRQRRDHYTFAAHEYGLSWHEQTPQGFKEHLVIG